MTEVTGMAAVITTLGSVITGVVSWAGEVIGIFTTAGNEILLVPIGLVVAAWVFQQVKSLMG